MCTLRIVVLAVLALAVSPASRSSADEKADPARARTLARVVELLAAGDSFAAAEVVQGRGEPVQIAQRYLHVVADLYWVKKDVRGCVALGRAAALYCLGKAQELEATDAALARRLRHATQMLAFDVASYAWPGWDEEGVEIGPAELAAGLEMARLDVRLVGVLGLGPEKQSNATWILGAQLLAAGRHAEAQAAFERARGQAQEAGVDDKVWMLAGYVGIAQALQEGTRKEGRARIDAAVAKLEAAGTEDAKAYARQLRDVFAVFTR